MTILARQDLMSLEEYAQARSEFRATVLEHKKPRKVHLNEHVTLYFEDRLTMQYQIQEMLRIEKIFEADGIQEELDAYNPLIPDGSNFKATFMIEYDDVDQRKVALASLIGIEDKVWVQAAGMEKVYAIADEDLERATEEKTSAVHFLRFELNQDMIRALHKGASLSMGIEHPVYLEQIKPVDKLVSNSLIDDLDR